MRCLACVPAVLATASTAAAVRGGNSKVTGTQLPRRYLGCFHLYTRYFSCLLVVNLS